MPPICSLVSAYGPSVTATRPSFHRRVAAASGPISPSPPAKCPFFLRTSSYARHSSTIALRSVSEKFSNLPGSIYPRQTNFILFPFLIDGLSWVSRSGILDFDRYLNFFATPSSEGEWCRQSRDGSG